MASSKSCTMKMEANLGGWDCEVPIAKLNCLGLRSCGEAGIHHDLVLSLSLTTGRMRVNLSIRPKSQVSGLTPVSPAHRIRQEDCYDFKACLSATEKPWDSEFTSCSSRHSLASLNPSVFVHEDVRVSLPIAGNIWILACM